MKYLVFYTFATSNNDCEYILEYSKIDGKIFKYYKIYAQ